MHLFDRHAFEKDSTGEVCHVLERQAAENISQPIGKKIEREHVARKEEIHEHVNEHERGDFQPPKRNKAKRCFEKKADAKGDRQ